MTPVDKMINALSQFEAKAPPRLDARVREHVYEAFANPSSAVEPQSHHLRLIACRQITQVAAAIAAVGATLVGLYLWTFGGTEVYAVGQTVDALRKVETVHVFCTGWEGQKFEMWMKPDPATGANDFISVIEPQRGDVAVSTPDVSYEYHAGRKLVRVIRGQMMTSDLNLTAVVESMAREADGTGDSIEIGRKITHYGEVITLHRTGPTREYEAWIDPQSKLLLTFECIRRGDKGEFVRSMDEIRYNEPVPDTLLHYECPEAATIQPEGWGNLDDPNCGIDVTGLSDEQACRRVVTQLFEAINAADLGQVRRLIPLTRQWDDNTLIAAVRGVAGRLWDDPTPGVAAYEIGSPYRDKACPLGALVPCVLTDHREKRFEVTLIVRFRQTDERRTCVVVYPWGHARAIGE